MEPKETPKSNDASLKSIKINGEKVEVKDEIRYSTYDKTIEIEVETNDKKAKYEIGDTGLQVGENTIVIKVVAEDKTTKEYKIIAKRLKLSSNTNLLLYINDVLVKFENDIAIIDADPELEEIDYRYEPEDKKAKVEINADTKLKDGENIFDYKVTAEDGSTKTYRLIVNRASKTDEIVDETIGAIIVVGFLSGIGFLIYYLKKEGIVS